MQFSIFGHSPQSLPIYAYHFGTSGPKVLILGGVHGNEPEGVVLAKALIESFHQSFCYKLQITVVPEFNQEGILNKSRLNSNGVDLNRNLPTKDWSKTAFDAKYPPGPFACSEPENQALCNWIKNEKPHFIISLHSWYPLLNTNGNCHPEAQVIQSFTGYKITDSIGYPTPGCLGTYTGLEMNIPTLTYEIERGQSFQDIIKIHKPALLEALKYTEKRQIK